MSEWVRAAEVQLETYRWLTSEIGQRWLHSWVSAERTREPEKAEAYRAMMFSEPPKLLSADAIWVSPEICDVIDAASESFQPEAMVDEDFITKTGFLYFAKPLYMQDRNQKIVSIGAVSWCYYTHLDYDGAKEALREGRAELSVNEVMEEEGVANVTISHPKGEEPFASKPLGMAITLYSSSKAELDDFSHMHETVDAGELVPLHFASVIFDSMFDEGDLYDTRGNYTGADQWWKIVQTSLRLMQQRVAQTADTPLPRAERRRQERAGTGVREVLVVRLRRPATHANEDVGEDAPNWTHRWIVDGHWRNQWYPSIHKHRQIWISPYVKGPEDQPLVVKRRYYKWDR